MKVAILKPMSFYIVLGMSVMTILIVVSLTPRNTLRVHPCSNIGVIKLERLSDNYFGNWKTNDSWILVEEITSGGLLIKEVGLPRGERRLTHPYISVYVVIFDYHNETSNTHKMYEHVLTVACLYNGLFVCPCIAI